MNLSIPPLFLLLLIDGFLILGLDWLLHRKFAHQKNLFIFFKVLIILICLRLILYWGLLAVPNLFDFSFWFFVQVIWLIGTMVAFCFLFSRYYRLYRSRRFLKSLPKDYLSKAAKEQIAPNVKIYQSAAVDSPCVVGILHPALIFPLMPLLPGEEDYVLAHELNHLKNHDPLKKFLGELLLALYWCFPPAYFLIDDLNLINEITVDRQVVKNRGQNYYFGYVENLLSVAKRAKEADRRMSDANFFLGKNYLNIRIDFLLNSYNVGRPSVTFRLLTVVLLICLILIYGI
ncbi:M56 family metallopeptidase [Xylocopilactobacillus apicola]|uniref:Peptidase M56 domain-containing protein n=1 Tax=Xylocopilactobacillus apicola TaxID=2932184 RepID=A0AAU9DUT7_9LACO|nr:M56 family metallopeptidase [Xylocopilactobacillus apicola]BDR59273.1 hypothetical protein XA3_17140 [Xylocopilactobacillus apicola]